MNPFNLLLSQNSQQNLVMKCFTVCLQIWGISTGHSERDWLIECNLYECNVNCWGVYILPEQFYYAFMMRPTALKPAKPVKDLKKTQSIVIYLCGINSLVYNYVINLGKFNDYDNCSLHCGPSSLPLGSLIR